MEAVKLSIAEQIFEKMEEAMRSKEELEVVNYQLERRIDQMWKNIDGTISVIRRDKVKFQEEMRATLEAFRSQCNPRVEQLEIGFNHGY